ncbi:MAG: glycosyltransferase family 10 [Prevotella sp.]|nr:glycosyltransferase family 10 [Prevotella sp.]
MYKVLLLNGTGEKGRWILRQTHNGNGISSCGKYQFFINEDIDSPDFVIVRGKAVRQPVTLHVAPENTILTTSEPYSVLSYPKKYCRQFGLVCSCQKELKHHNIRYTPAILPWFTAATFDHGNGTATLTYDELKAMPTPKKPKLMSVITSNKAFTQGHQERIDFVEKLKKHYGDKLDVFGRGFRSFDDKWEVLADYKYHIVIENSQSDYYWTEKLSDCFLSETFPIYYGCTNVDEYFSKDAYAVIDIHDFDRSVAAIDAIINSDEHYAEHSPALKEAKRQVLEDYNIFNYLATILDTMNPDLPKQNVTLKPAKTMADPHNFYLNVIGRNWFKLKNTVRRLFAGASPLNES